MTKKTSERRATARVPVRIRIQYETADKFFQDYIQNLSTGGILVQTPNPLRVGTKLKVQFCLPDMEEPIFADAIVVHKMEVGRNNPKLGGMGIKFSELDDENKKFLEKYIRITGIS